MPDTPDIRSVLDAAERAADLGDYATAEARLREVARLQEATLGPRHPDLANTLNNLGVICEITGKPDDAERCFREAWTMASAVLPPHHPFVATSRKNLEEFCAEHGKAVELPLPSGIPPSPPPAPPSSQSASAVAPVAPVTGAADRGLRPSATGRPPRVPPAGLRAGSRDVQWDAPGGIASRRRPSTRAAEAVITAVVAVVLVALVIWFQSGNEVQPPPVSQGTPVPEIAPTPAAPVPEPGPSGASRETTTGGKTPENPALPGTTSTPPTGGAASAPSSQPSAPRESPSPGSSAAGSIAVVDARLCNDLSRAGREWRCVPPDRPASPGRFFFYTRLRSPVDTTIEHRWYRDDRLHQVVELRIRANMGAGYRTYSRSTISRERAGDWRVELRTQGGKLLHEERFVVR